MTARLTRRERTALRFLGYGLMRAGMLAPQAGPTTLAQRIRRVNAATALLLIALTEGACTAPVHLANACRDHQHGIVRFNESDCPVAVCRPVDGGSAWVALEDACR
jgi:hypothetical protein